MSNPKRNSSYPSAPARYNRHNLLPNSAAVLVYVSNIGDIAAVVGAAARLTAYKDASGDGRREIELDTVFEAQPTVLGEQSLVERRLDSAEHVRREVVKFEDHEALRALEQPGGCWAAISIRPAATARKVEMLWEPLDDRWFATPAAASQFPLPILGDVLPFTASVGSMAEAYPAAWTILQTSLKLIAGRSVDMLPNVSFAPVPSADITFFTEHDAAMRKVREERQLVTTRKLVDKLKPEEREMVVKMLLAARAAAPATT